MLQVKMAITVTLHWGMYHNATGDILNVTVTSKLSDSPGPESRTISYRVDV